MKNFYECLGVTPQASDKEIKTAYRRLAKKYHPDAIKDHPDWSEKMYEIQAAYEVLGDPGKRKKYDESLLSKEKKEKQKAGGEPGENPGMSQFERFFGFQPGKGMETYHDKKSGEKKPGGPINPDALFEAYFGKIKK